MYEIYCKYRDAKGLKDADVARATGFRRSTFSDWKHGRCTPRNDRLKKIAEVLGIPMEYFFHDENSDSNRKYYFNDEAAEMAQTIYEDKNLRLLFDAARDIAPEDFETVHAVLKALKRKERGYDDAD